MTLNDVIPAAILAAASLAVALSGAVLAVTVENRLAIADIRGRMTVRTEDRYTATHAQKDLAEIRSLIAADRDDLLNAVKTRDVKFDEVHRRLDAIEKRLGGILRQTSEIAGATRLRPSLDQGVERRDTFGRPSPGWRLQPHFNRRGDER